MNVTQNFNGTVGKVVSVPDSYKSEMLIQIAYVLKDIADEDLTTAEKKIKRLVQSAGYGK